MDRRSFLRGVAALGGAVVASACGADEPRARRPTRSVVALVATGDRADGVRRALGALALPPWKGRRLFVKPNLNSADPFPGSTHLDTLAALLRELARGGAARLSLGDRSGMGDTRAVMESKGVLSLARDLGVEVHVLDALPAAGWVRQQGAGSHWSRGFALARPALEADGIVQTCCLKTHRFGGHFTLSLKNSVGLVAKRIPGDAHDYMQELHGSPDQRRMIAEINAAYRPLAVVMDALEGFADGGPETGRRIAPGLVLASTDRVALDAVGVALLRAHGTTPDVSRGRVFDQEQIARAAELGVGAASPDEVEIAADDAASREQARRLSDLLRA
jgi:uncharacterized protein (DUF362 family)